MKRKIAVLNFITVFLSAFITLALFSNVRSEMLESEEPHPAAIQKRKVDKIEARIQELDDKLGLKLEQKIQIKNILTKEKGETSKALNEAGVKVKKIKEKFNTEIETVLTKRQRDLLREVPEEEEEEEEELLQVFISNKR